MLDPQKIWQGVLGELELALSKANFTTWFANTFIIDVNKDDKEVIIGVPNAFTKSWLEKKYNKYIVEALGNVCNKKIKKVSYQIKSQKQAQQKKVDILQNVKTKTAKTKSVNTNKLNNSFTLRPGYTFKNFVVGSGNQLAHSASLAVVEDLGKRYNPLFLYGDVGLGKTHLLHAIGNKVQNKNKEVKVLYLNFEKFTNDFVAAARKGSFDQFRNKYRNADLLLVDDVQFMIDKEKTQDEFFHTFEALHQQNKQIVITSDRPPKALVELQDRMISRFEWGMIADIKMPDLETRLAILKNKCKEKDFHLDQEIIIYMAQNIKNNIRELEGALNKLIAWSDLQGKELTLNSARDILINLVADPSKKAVNSKQIIETVADFYELEPAEITGSCRKRKVAIPRQIAMFLMREQLDYSYPTIGDKIGGRDHTTAMYACQKIEEIINNDERIRQEIESLRQRLVR